MHNNFFTFSQREKNKRQWLRRKNEKNIDETCKYNHRKIYQKDSCFFSFIYLVNDFKRSNQKQNFNDYISFNIWGWEWSWFNLIWMRNGVEWVLWRTICFHFTYPQNYIFRNEMNIFTLYALCSTKDWTKRIIQAG